MKFFVQSLGCPKNLVDTEMVVATMMDSGGELVYDEAQADILLLNTCSFIEDSRQESFEEIERLLEFSSKDKKLFVYGCLPQMWKKKLLRKYPQIDGIMGVNDLRVGIENLLAGTKSYFTEPMADEDSVRAILTSPHSVYLKIAEGCDHTCAFCTIPAIRGPFRSRELETIVAEAKLLVDNGAKEISLLAQDSTAYGQDIYGKLLLSGLLKELDKLGVWIRVMYMYPATVTVELLDTIGKSKHILPYFDVPFQHVSKTVLQRMGRGDVDIVALVAKIRTLKRASIRGTFIVGYPGETQEEFDELKSFLETSRLDRVALFAYSKEVDTVAAGLAGQLPESVKQARLEQVVDIHSKIVDKYNNDIVGKCVEVLFDNEIGGRTYRDAPDVDGYVELINGYGVVGSINKVKIVAAEGYTLKGEISDNSNIYNAN